MKSKEERNGSSDEQQFELKYCERCGGLWLRPMGGGQVYCVACGREMNKLPRVSQKSEHARIPQGPGCGEDHEEFGSYEEDEDMDADVAGGVA